MKLVFLFVFIYLDERIEENENLLDLKLKQEQNFTQLNQQNQILMDKINDIRSKHRQIKDAWKGESRAFYGELQSATDDYNEIENEFQLNKNEIRIEMHDDMNIIKDLEESIGEADVICGSLAHKARFS
jgi:predicted  nucleic acid-binding Zn-ribbon protein